MTALKPRALAALCLALTAVAPSLPARADNGLPASFPAGALAYPGGLPAGLLPSGMLMPMYPGMYPMMPSPYMAYPGLPPAYLGGLPMALPGLLPAMGLPSGALLQGALPPAPATLPGLAPSTSPAWPPTPAPAPASSGPEAIAPFTGFQLPAIGGMTELPPLVPAEVQSLDPPRPPTAASAQAAPPPVPPAAPAAAPAPSLPPSTPATGTLPVAAAVAATPPPSLPVAPALVSPAPAAPPSPPSLPFPFPFSAYAAPAAEPAAPLPPYTVRRVISQQEKSQLMQMAMPLMTGLMRMSLADAVNHFAVKYKAKPGLTYDQVVEAMKRRAGTLGMQLVGEQRLTAAGKDGIAAGPRIEVYSFWDAALGAALIQASPEFVVFLPGRVAVLEDADKGVWVMSMDWNPEWVLGYKDKLAISDNLWRGAVDLRERLDAILRAAADGAP